jgi:cyclopropane-fatty-acyl-phospholipid synthase
VDGTIVGERTLMQGNERFCGNRNIEKAISKKAFTMKMDDAELLKSLDQYAGGGIGDGGIQRTHGQQPPLSLEGRLMRHLLHALGDPPMRLTLWNGESITGGTGGTVGGLRIADRTSLLKLLIYPNLYFGEAYSNGSIEVEGDLVKLLETVYRHRLRPNTPCNRWLKRAARWIHHSRRNTLSTARDNIHHHYDLGNEFYGLWLDQQMSYTCAYFPSPDVTLEQAQIAKMDLVCRKLKLRADDTVVEAGCGWGALALHMAKHYGARVKAFNISREQISCARARARALNLERRVEFIEDDYRNISGRHDAFVSVGMLEHVGPSHYDALGRLIERCLTGNGRGLLHSIGQTEPAPFNAWIRKRIFPGAYPPTLREMTEIIEPHGFSVIDVENLRLHYALTLKHWLQRFEDARERVSNRYDDAFVRAWRLYLSGSLAAFNTGQLQLFQVLFARAASNDVPWTRAHLYRHSGAG